MPSTHLNGPASGPARGQTPLLAVAPEVETEGGIGRKFTHGRVLSGAIPAGSLIAVSHAWERLVPHRLWGLPLPQTHHGLIAHAGDASKLRDRQGRENRGPG